MHFQGHAGAQGEQSVLLLGGAVGQQQGFFPLVREGGVGGQPRRRAPVNGQEAHRGRQGQGVLDDLRILLPQVRPLPGGAGHVEQHQHLGVGGGVAGLDLPLPRAQGGGVVEHPGRVPGLVGPRAVDQAGVGIDEAAHQHIPQEALAGQGNLLRVHEPGINQQMGVAIEGFIQGGEPQQLPGGEGHGGQPVIPPAQAAHLMAAGEPGARGQEKEAAVVQPAVDFPHGHGAEPQPRGHPGLHPHPGQGQPGGIGQHLHHLRLLPAKDRRPGEAPAVGHAPGGPAQQHPLAQARQHHRQKQRQQRHQASSVGTLTRARTSSTAARWACARSRALRTTSRWAHRGTASSFTSSGVTKSRPAMSAQL